MLAYMTPIYERRQEILNKPDYIREVVIKGNQNARKIARSTIEDVRNALKIDWE
jgi:tryptophanyl-tRNA synthetase